MWLVRFRISVSQVTEAGAKTKQSEALCIPPPPTPFLLSLSFKVILSFWKISAACGAFAV